MDTHTPYNNCKIASKVYKSLKLKHESPRVLKTHLRSDGRRFLLHFEDVVVLPSGRSIGKLSGEASSRTPVHQHASFAFVHGFRGHARFVVVGKCRPRAAEQGGRNNLLKEVALPWFHRNNVTPASASVVRMIVYSFCLSACLCFCIAVPLSFGNYGLNVGIYDIF